MNTLVIQYEGVVPLTISISRAIQREIEMLKLAVHASKRALARFETRYAMPSDGFFEFSVRLILPERNT